MPGRKRICGVAATVLALSPSLPRDAPAQWSGDPAVNTRVCAAAARQDSPRVIVDALGRSTWVWQDAREGATDVYAQRLDARGNRLWGEWGTGACVEPHSQAAPQIVTAGVGDVIVTWEDARSDSGDVFAQRLDDTGASRWTPNGLPACAEPGRQFAPAAVADDSGGVIIAWLDRRDASNTAVYAQRLDPDGARRWPADGVPVCVVPGAHAAPAAAADGVGGAFVLWADSRGGYRARRVDRDGIVHWAAEGVPLCTAGKPRSLRGIPDGLGGLLVAWDRTDGTGFFRDIYALRFDGTGAALWPDTGVVLSHGALLQRYPVLAADGAGGAIVAWEDGRDFHLAQVYAQRVDASGVPLWTIDGVPVCSSNTTQPSPAIAPDGAGGALVAWQDSRGGGVDIYAQCLDADGVPRWPLQGVPVSTAPDTQFAVIAAADDGGGWIVGWTDGRDAATRTDICAARLQSDGTLDATPLAVPRRAGAPGDAWLEPVSPNPARSFADLTFVLARPTPATLEVFDTRGRRLRTLASGPHAAGRHAARWDLRDESGRAVENGMFYIRLSAAGRRLGVRCVAIR